MRSLWVVAFFVALAGCTHGSEALMVSAPASEVRIDRRVEQPVLVVIDSTIDSMSREAAENSYVCSAQSYPITVGPSIRSSIINVLEEAFTDVQISESSKAESEDGFVMWFRPDTFRPTISFAQGFWQGTANASSEIVLKVTAMYKNKIVFDNITISGRGASNGEHRGGCDVGANALRDAAQDSIQRLMENLVHKTINTGDFKLLEESSKEPG